MELVQSSGFGRDKYSDPKPAEQRINLTDLDQTGSEFKPMNSISGKQTETLTASVGSAIPSQIHRGWNTESALPGDGRLGTGVKVDEEGENDAYAGNSDL